MKNKLKIVLNRPFRAEDLEYLNKSLKEKFEILNSNDFDESEYYDYLPYADIIIGNDIKIDDLKKASSLKLFQNLGAGIDHIDLSAIKKEE